MAVVADVFQHVEHQHRIEGRGSEWQCFRDANDEMRSADLALRGSYVSEVEIEPNNLRSPVSQIRGDVSVRTAEVENGSDARKPVVGKRGEIPKWRPRGRFRGFRGRSRRHRFRSRFCWGTLGGERCDDNLAKERR